MPYLDQVNNRLIWSSGESVLVGNYSIGRDDDSPPHLHFNVPSASDGFEFSIEGIAHFTLDDGQMIFGQGGAIADITQYSVGRDADGPPNQLHLNVPTGAGFEFSINDVAEMKYTTGAMAFQQATTISTTTGALTLTSPTIGATDWNSANHAHAAASTGALS